MRTNGRQAKLDSSMHVRRCCRLSRLRNLEFDVEQTDGEPLPEPGEASGDPGAKTAALKAAILERGITLESVDDLDGALGTSSGGCIRLLNGLSPATEVTTLVHEYAHLCSAVVYVRSGRC